LTRQANTFSDLDVAWACRRPGQIDPLQLDVGQMSADEIKGERHGVQWSGSSWLMPTPSGRFVVERTGTSNTGAC